MNNVIKKIEKCLGYKLMEWQKEHITKVFNERVKQIEDECINGTDDKEPKGIMINTQTLGCRIVRGNL